MTFLIEFITFFNDYFCNFNWFFLFRFKNFWTSTDCNLKFISWLNWKIKILIIFIKNILFSRINNHYSFRRLIMKFMIFLIRKSMMKATINNWRNLVIQYSIMLTMNFIYVLILNWNLNWRHKLFQFQFKADWNPIIHWNLLWTWLMQLSTYFSAVKNFT